MRKMGLKHPKNPFSGEQACDCGFLADNYEEHIDLAE